MKKEVMRLKSRERQGKECQVTLPLIDNNITQEEETKETKKARKQLQELGAIK